MSHNTVHVVCQLIIDVALQGFIVRRSLGLISRESDTDVFLQLHNLVFNKQFHGEGLTCNLVLVLDVITVIAEDAHDIEVAVFFEESFDEILDSQDLYVQLRLVIILVGELVRNDSVVGLTYYGNEEVQKDDAVEELVEEPQNPNQVNHHHWLAYC